MKPFVHKIAMLSLAAIIIERAGQVGAQTLPPAATNLWVAVFPGYQNRSSSTPAVAPDGTIYVGTFLGDFMAYTPAGECKWSFKAGREIKSSPAIADDGTIYFGSRDRKFYALTPAGLRKWTFATGAWVDSSPAVAADGTVYFGGWDGFFYALTPEGTLKWKTNIGAIVDSSPAISADGTVYFGAHDKKCYALHPDGLVRWAFATGGVIISSPAIGADGTVYVSSTDGYLYALHPDGTERWCCHTGGATESSPVLGAQGDICIGTESSTVFIMEDGRERLRFGSPVWLDVSAAAVGDRFYFSAPWRTVTAIIPQAPQDKRWIWSADIKDNASTSLTVGPNGIFYLCAGFQLYAIRPPGELLSPFKSPWPMFRANPQHTGRAGEDGK